MKNTIKILCFCFLLVSMLWKTDEVFRVKYGDGIYDMVKFYELEDNSVDTLVLGSSHAFEDINTGVLWDQHGIASYVLGGSIQPMWNTYYYLKEALKTQTPELIILEAYCTTHPYDYIDDSRIIKNTYGMKWSQDKVDAVKVSAPQERWTEFLIPYIQYHTRYTELSKEDFLKNKGDIRYQNWKGFGCNMAVTPFETPRVQNVSQRADMSEKTEKYYRKTIELAAERNIPILVLLSPYAGITEAEQAVFNTAGDIAAEYGVDFVNYNLLYDEIGLDFTQDAADFGHLNYKGNQKFTAALGDYVAQHYCLTDRRGNLSYESWEAEARYIEAAIRNQELTEAVTIAQLAQKLQCPDYTIYVCVDDGCRENEQNLRELFAVLGIPYAENNSFWAVENIDNICYEAGMEETILHLRPDWHDFCFTRSLSEDEQSYVNTLTLDRTTYRVADTGVNMLIYDKVTQIVADCIGTSLDGTMHSMYQGTDIAID